jgi:hypothetical protein
VGSLQFSGEAAWTAKVGGIKKDGDAEFVRKGSSFVEMISGAGDVIRSSDAFKPQNSPQTQLVYFFLAESLNCATSRLTMASLLRSAARPFSARIIGASNPSRCLSAANKTFVRTKATLPDLACASTTVEMQAEY